MNQKIFIEYVRDLVTVSFDEIEDKIKKYNKSLKEKEKEDKKKKKIMQLLLKMIV